MNRLIEIYAHGEVRTLDDSGLPLHIVMDDSSNVCLCNHLDGKPGVVAYLAESRDHLFLQPAENAPVKLLYHNDEALTASVWLKSGDQTRIGDSVLRWHLSGQRLEVHISHATADLLQPPTEPPGPVAATPAGESDSDQVLLAAPVSRPAGSGYRNAAIILFVLLLLGAAFVLLANPLAVTVTPLPDKLSVSGFPPPVKFGASYLGLSGDYTLRAEKTGYQPLEEQVRISGKNSQYSFTMQKLPGLIDFSSSPAGVTVVVDGASVGVTPLREVKVPAGERSVRFEHARYLPLEMTFEVEGFGQKQNLQAELEPAWAVVTLQTEPAGASLFVDGEEQGQTPLVLELIAGERKLLFGKDNFAPLEIELLVEAGQDLSPSAFHLEPSPATLALSSEPSGASVTLDGRYQGLTPLAISLSSGKQHELRLTLAGHRPESRQLTLGPAESRDLDVRLEPQFGTLFIAVTPASATLSIDGKQQNQASGRFQLPTRAHRIEARASGYQSVSREVTPRSGYSQRIEIDLPREKAVSQAVTPTGPEAVLTTAQGQKLVLIAPKSFRMGASRTEAGRRANESEHEVLMKRSYYLATREVTNAAYKLFQAQHSSGMAGNRSLDVDSHPVANVTWDDAARFLNWLSKQDGLPPFYREENGRMTVVDTNGTGYRLPTEAEWEFAARMAGQKERLRYPWPGKYPPKGVVGNFADESARHLVSVVVEGYNDGFAATAPVGSFPANPVGIQDLGGNVAEWCHDYYAANPASSGKGEVDPTGASQGTHHVVRGSSWRDASITELRFSYRRYSKEPANDIGFRIARYAP